MTGFIGVLMLDTAFARIAGDAGHPDTYHRPARLHVVRGAGSTDIVRDGQPDPALVDTFCAAAQTLQAQGALALTSTCGFLVTLQDRIAAAVDIPVMVSALSLFPAIYAAHGQRPVGIISASQQSLGPTALRAAGIATGQAIIAGMADCPAFADTILVPKAQQTRALDHHAIGLAVVEKASGLCAANPDIGAILLECGNLPPYAAAITAATGRRVYDIRDAARLIAP